MTPNQLQWACRRGMLELDIVLGRYLSERYWEASKETQHAFRTLLSREDQYLFDCLIKALPAEPEDVPIIAEIMSWQSTP